MVKGKPKAKKMVVGTVTTTTRSSTQPQTRKTTRKNKSAIRASNVADGKSRGLIPAWLSSIATPWAKIPAHIPDECVTRSGLATSHIQYVGTPTTLGTQLTHGFGFVLPAWPYFNYIQDNTVDGNAGNKGYSDLNPAGTAFATPFTAASQPQPSVIPNFAAVMGTTDVLLTRSKIRCVGISITIVYEGTEFQRSGKITAGLIPMNGVGAVVPTTGTFISMNSAAIGSPAFQPVDIRTQAVKYYEQRVSNQPFTARWIPQGAPSYQLIRGFANNDSTYAIGAGTVPVTSPWAVAPNQFGVQAGQCALVVLVDGDATAGLSPTGNLFTVNIDWNWEVIPDVRESVAYCLSDSPSHAGVMDHCLNAFQRLTLSPTPGNGTAVS